MQAKYIPPAIDKVAFNCPHCGALANQTWFNAYADRLNNRKTPLVWNRKKLSEALNDLSKKQEFEVYKRLGEIGNMLVDGVPFVDREARAYGYHLSNVFFFRVF